MSFNKLLFTSIFYFCLLLMVSSCGEFLSPQKKEDDILDARSEELACLEEVPNQLQRTIDGKMQVSDLDSAMNCFSKSITVFKKRTRGEQINTFSYHELIRFLNRYFMKENQISEKYAESIFQLKAAVFGGTETQLSYEDLDVLLAWMERVKEGLKGLSPHLPLLTMRLDSPIRSDISRQQVLDSVDQLNQFVSIMFTGTNVWKSGYHFEQFKDFLHLTLEFTRNYWSFDQLMTLKKVEPLLPQLKNILISKKAIQNPADFQDCLRTFVQIYGFVVQYKYLRGPTLVGNLNDLAKTTRLALDLFQILQLSPAIQKDGTIELANVEDFLIVALDPKKNFFDTEIEALPVFSGLKGMLSSVFDDKKRIAKSALHAIDFQHLQEMKKEGLILLEATEVMKKAFSQFNESEKGQRTPWIELQTLLASWKKAPKEKILAALIKEFKAGSLVSEIKSGIDDFEEIFRTNYQVQYDQNESIIIGGNHVPVSFRSETMAKVILMNALTRLLLVGYSDQDTGSVKNRRLTLKNMSDWYADYRSLGISLKAFDPRSENSGPRSFYEASFFTFSGNGDAHMDFHESYELVSFLFSAGLNGAEVLRNDLENAHCMKSEIDVFGFPKIERKCFIKVWREKIPLRLSNIPGMAQFIKGLSDKDFADYFNHLEEGALSAHPELFDTSDLRTLVAVTHYIESLFTTFDLNHDDNLQFLEVRSASPRFRPFVLDIVKKEVSFTLLQKPFVAQAAFEYMVINGRKPETTAEMADLVKFWIKNKDNLTASRMNLFKVFKVIRAAILR